MPDTSPPSPADMARAVRQLAETYFPGLVADAELRVKHHNGRESIVCGAVGGADLPERQRDILQALEEAGESARLSGAALARLSGYENDSHFREDLAALRKLGRVVNHNPGYSLPVHG